MRRQPLAAVLAAASAGFAGCASKTPPPTNSLAIPAPAAGTAWQATPNGGGQNFGETTADTSPWITVGQDGGVQARIPASAQTKSAAGEIESGNIGVITIRRAP
jgi:hypothetical protein